MRMKFVRSVGPWSAFFVPIVRRPGGLPDKRKEWNNTMSHRVFTSESVTEGHPDKVCDQISDAVLDAILEKDPSAHVACECCATTGMVLVMGATTSGVTGWFSLFSGYMLQPSEFAKLASILHMAKFFARKENPVENMRDFVTMMVLMGAPLLLIFAQGELGTVMVFIAIYGAMMIMSGISLKLIGGMLLAGVTALVPVVIYWRATGSYRYDRLLGFFNPEMASSDSVYQATNSKTAIGNGGLRGVGLFKDGTYSALDYVPQDHTDFIFSSIGETMGFIGCAVVMILYLLMIFRLLTLALNTYDKFARLVIVGFMMMIFFHAFYNIGMTIGIMPVMGIPLPFLSYGGSNLIANMGGVGLVLNITLRKPQMRMSTIDQAVMMGNLPRKKKKRFG